MTLKQELAECKAKLAALANVGITCDRLVSFHAFTPEAKAAYPVKPEFMIVVDQVKWKRKR